MVRPKGGQVPENNYEDAKPDILQIVGGVGALLVFTLMGIIVVILKYGCKRRVAQAAQEAAHEAAVAAERKLIKRKARIEKDLLVLVSDLCKSV